MPTSDTTTTRIVLVVVGAVASIIINGGMHCRELYAMNSKQSNFDYFGGHIVTDMWLATVIRNYEVQSYMHYLMSCRRFTPDKRRHAGLVTNKRIWCTEFIIWQTGALDNTLASFPARQLGRGGAVTAAETAMRLNAADGGWRLNWVYRGHLARIYPYVWVRSVAVKLNCNRRIILLSLGRGAASLHLFFGPITISTPINVQNYFKTISKLFQNYLMWKHCSAGVNITQWY